MSTRLSIGLFGFLAIVTLLLPVRAAWSTTYYVDPAVGNDGYDGKSQTVNGNNVGPWRSQKHVQDVPLAAGDIVKFKKGSVFTNGFYISQNGTSASNGAITFTSYGASGNAPVFKNGNNTSDGLNAIDVAGDYIIIDGLSAQAAHHAGIQLGKASSHVTVRNCYITNVGIAVFLDSSSYNTITRNNVVSLHMVNNNGVNDFGANGVWLDNNSSHNRITENIFSKCRAPSIQFDEDGGALEIYLGTAGSVCDDTIFEKNQVDEGAGVVEIGGAQGQVSNLTVRYNACYKNGAFCALHPENYSNVVFENNTIVEPYDFLGKQITFRYAIMNYDAGFQVSTTVWRNNIFYVGRDFTKLAYGFIATHYDNDYFLEDTSNTDYGLVPNTNGNITGNPRFISYNPSLGFSSQNFRLQSTTPATGKGAYVTGGLP